MWVSWKFGGNGPTEESLFYSSAMAGHDFDDDFVADDLVALSEDEGEIEELDDSQSNGEAESSNATALKKRKRREKTKERKVGHSLSRLSTHLAHTHVHAEKKNRRHNRTNSYLNSYAEPS